MTLVYIYVYFLESAQVAGLVDAMARRFPGGRLVYDAESPELVAASEQAVRERGIDAAPMPFRVADRGALRGGASVEELAGPLGRPRVNGAAGKSHQLLLSSLTWKRIQLLLLLALYQAYNALVIAGNTPGCTFAITMESTKY